MFIWECVYACIYFMLFAHAPRFRWSARAGKHKIPACTNASIRGAFVCVRRPLAFDYTVMQSYKPPSTYVLTATAVATVVATASKDVKLSNYNWILIKYNIQSRPQCDVNASRSVAGAAALCSTHMFAIN